MMIPAAYTYGAISATLASAAIGVSIGQAIAGGGAQEAMNRQPAAHTEIMRVALIGMVLLETAALLATAMAIWVFFETDISLTSLESSISHIGIACAMGFPCFFLGLSGGIPTRHACLAVARQPFFSQRIQQLLLITLSMAQTPILFGFIVSFFIKNGAMGVSTITQSLQLIATGLAMGVGSIGPAIGLTQFSAAACTSIGINKTIFGHIRLFSLVSQTFVETPILFALVASLAILIKPVTITSPLSVGIVLIAVSLCTGIGTLAPSISSAYIASKAAQRMAFNPELTGGLSRMSLLGQVFTDTCALYPLLISLLILVVSPS